MHKTNRSSQTGKPFVQNLSCDSEKQQIHYRLYLKKGQIVLKIDEVSVLAHSKRDVSQPSKPLPLIHHDTVHICGTACAHHYPKRLARIAIYATAPRLQSIQFLSPNKLHP